MPKSRFTESQIVGILKEGEGEARSLRSPVRATLA